MCWGGGGGGERRIGTKKKQQPNEPHPLKQSVMCVCVWRGGASVSVLEDGGLCVFMCMAACVYEKRRNSSQMNHTK